MGAAWYPLDAANVVVGMAFVDADSFSSRQRRAATKTLAIEFLPGAAVSVAEAEILRVRLAAAGLLIQDPSGQPCPCLDPAPVVVASIAPPTSAFVCDVCYPSGDGGAKVKCNTLAFRLAGGGTALSNAQEGKASVSGATLVAGIITRASCVTGTVSITGDQLTVANWRGADLVCTVTDGAGATQTITVHASCSKPLHVRNPQPFVVQCGKNATLCA